MWWNGLRRNALADGPYDAWLTPRLEMTWRTSATRIVDSVAKIGGQPVWLDKPFWPVSAASGVPMTFVGQFPLPGPKARMSYLFIAQDDDTTLTFEPESGENALLVQPGGRVPSFVTGIGAGTGPSLWRRGTTWTERVPVELYVDAHPADLTTQRAVEREAARQASARREELLDLDGDRDEDWVSCRSYMGGPPLFWQPWTTHIDPSWRFLFQLDGAEGIEEDAYALNFGGGTGYAFLTADEREGRFLWDSV